MSRLWFYLYMFGKQKRGESLSYLCSRNSGSTHLPSSVENPTLYFLGTSLITVVGKVGTSLDSLLRNAGTCLSEPDFWFEIHLSEVGGGSKTRHTSFFNHSSIQLIWNPLQPVFQWSRKRLLTFDDIFFGIKRDDGQVASKASKAEKSCSVGWTKKNTFFSRKQKAEPTTHLP